MTTSEAVGSLESQIGLLAAAYFPEFGASEVASVTPAASTTPTTPVPTVPVAQALPGAPVSVAEPQQWQAAPSPEEGYRPTLGRVGEAAPSISFPGALHETRSLAASAVGHPTAYVGARSVESVRADFPILSEIVDGKPLVWLDNAATTQRPKAVIDRIAYYYEHENSNVHRAAHALAARSTDAYEDARKKVAGFIGAPSPDDIVFVRGTTEGINLVARSFVRPLLKPGDEIILTQLEHHANIVPWQIIAAEAGAVLKVAPVDEHGQILLAEYSRLFTSRTKFASFAHVANALGTVTPAGELISIAHAHGVPTLLDAAQSAPHIPLDVQALDVDFLAFSGHKLVGPTGIGVVYGKPELLDAAQPYQGGGNMIADVTFERTQYQPAPAKFEAGTGNIADAVGLGAAIDYLNALGIGNIAAYEHALLQYGTEALVRIPGLRLIGTAAEKSSVLSFVLEGYDPVDVGQALSREGIAVRAGHHCAQPVLRHFGVEATVRPSIAFYNTCDELDQLADVVAHLARASRY